MKISIDNPDRLNDFVGFLRDGGCIALRLDDRTVEALVPRVASPLSERRELATYLRTWQAMHRQTSTHAAVEAASETRALAVAV